MIYLRNLKNLNLFFVVLYICRYIICIGCYGESVSNAFYYNSFFQFCFHDLIISPQADVQFLMPWCEA